MDTSKAVIERIRALCKEQKITPNALSRKAGISQSTVKSILVGESLSPGVVTLKKLCDGYGITLAEFFNTDVFHKLLVKADAKEKKPSKEVKKAEKPAKKAAPKKSAKAPAKAKETAKPAKSAPVAPAKAAAKNTKPRAKVKK